MYGLAAYCAIKSLLFTEEHKEICITTELLSYQLSKSLHTKRRFLENIETGYGELIDQLFIKEIDGKSKYRVIDCSKLFINGDNDYFTIVTYEEILKIFQIKSVNSFVLLRYFVFLIGTISSSIDVWLDAFQHKCRVVGNLTIPYLSQISGISEKSINEYNKILENAGLIYINRPNDIIINESSGEIKRMTNIYGRPADKLYIDAFAANQKKYEKSELTDMGEDTDGMVESTSKLRDIIKGMTGFDILESDGKTFKDMYTIISGIADKWQDLNDIDRASLLEQLAGKNQSNALAAALSSPDILKKSYEEATNAAGSAEREQQKYAQSVQYSIDQSKAKLEELANDFLSSDFLKGLIDVGGQAITVVDTLISKLGVIPTIGAGAGIFGFVKYFDYPQ